jgi:hypothetical protein
VFTQRRRNRVQGNLRSTYACRYRTGRVFRLSTEFLDSVTSGGVELIRVAGLYVAWAHPYSDEFENYADVRVMDLRTGKKLAPPTSQTLGNSFYATDTALTPRGSFAWIVQVWDDSNGQSPELTQVYTLIDGTVTKVDSAPGKGIEAASLQLEGTTPSWTDRGQTRQTMLPLAARGRLERLMWRP